MSGFDFAIDTSGELVLDLETYDILERTNDDLRIQLAYNRIKSVSRNWFIDEIGADLEELVGRACNADTAELGKSKIQHELTYDELWDVNDMVISVDIQNNINITYTVYLRTYQEETEEVITTEIICELDLIRGVNVRYGWEPRR